MQGNFSYHNPTLEKLREGIKIARENNVNWILALCDGMTDEQIAEAGLEALKNWMLDVGLPLTISENVRLYSDGERKLVCEIFGRRL